MKLPLYPKIFQIALVIFFATAITVPFILMVNPVNDLTEKRELSVLPDLSMNGAVLKRFPKAFDAYVNDHFGLRNALLNINARISHAIFGGVGSVKVIPGRDGWLFYASEQSVQDMLGLQPFSNAEVEKWWVSVNQRGEWLKQKNIEYRMVLAPDKHNVYPEYLPNNVKYAGKPRANAVRSRLSNSPYFIDILPALIAAKPQFGDRLYFKTDTHWTQAGAYIAYRKLMTDLRSEYSDHEISLGLPGFAPRLPAVMRDLAGMARIGGVEPDIAPREELRPCDKANVPLPPLGIDGADSIRMAAYSCKGGKGTALVFHDSFMEALEPYLSAAFSHVIYVWTRADDDIFVRMVMQLHPDVVIDERVERYMLSVPAANLSGAIEKLSSASARGYTSEAQSALQNVNTLVTGPGVLKTSPAGTVFDVPGSPPTVRVINVDQIGAGGVVGVALPQADTVQISGWAGIVQDKTRADYVVAAVRGKVVGAVPTTFARQDVAIAFDAPAMADSGFNMTLPLGLLQEAGGNFSLFSVHGGHAAPIDLGPLQSFLKSN